jgi:hypothetical protein
MAIEQVSQEKFQERQPFNPPAPTSKLGPILAGAPCLPFPGKEGYNKNPLTRSK